MTDETFHTVLGNMRRMHELGVVISCKSLIFKMTLETTFFPNFTVACDHICMTAQAGHFFLNHYCVVIPIACHFLFRLAFPLVTCRAIGKLLVFMFRVIGFLEVTVEASRCGNFDMRTLDYLRVTAYAFESLASSQFPKVMLVVKGNALEIIDCILDCLHLVAAGTGTRIVRNLSPWLSFLVRQRNVIYNLNQTIELTSNCAGYTRLEMAFYTVYLIMC